MSDRGTPLPTEGRLSGRIDHGDCDARRAAGLPAFLFRPLRQAPRLEPASPHRRCPRTLSPLENRQGQAQARHRSHARGARSSGRLPHRHRTGLRHRSRRNRAVVAARRPGGEGAHGMLILSPRAVARLTSYTPPWPLPKIFRLTNNGKLIEGVFAGETINTPSMLCVEDYLDTLTWAKSIGGCKALVARSDANTKAIADWVARTPWIAFLTEDPTIRSNTSVCLKVVDPAVTALAADAQAAFVKALAAALEKENIAYDIDAYRDAPPGLRIWCGATVETRDVEALTLWLDWAFARTKDALPKAA